MRFFFCEILIYSKIYTFGGVSVSATELLKPWSFLSDEIRKVSFIMVNEVTAGRRAGWKENHPSD